MIGWLEDPRALYPLAVGETVLERAMGVVISERQEKRWVALGGGKGDKSLLPKGYVRKRRRAVVEENFGEVMRERDVGVVDLGLGREDLGDGEGDAKL